MLKHRATHSLMTTLPSRLRCFSRAGFSLAAASLLVSLSAQSTPAPDETPPKDAPLILSKFAVTSTQDKGYTSTNAATGFKTNEDLMNIPQAVTLVTRDLINDIGAVDSSNILRYAGVGNFFSGESFALRGTRINYPLLDEMPDGTPYADNLNLDSYTVLRGPAATLYVNAALGGTVLTNSKFPLPNPMYSFTAKVTDYGTYRLETDATGPLGSIGEANFSYRLVAGLQEGDSYFKRIVDHRKLLHPTLQMTWKNTVVRIAYDQQQIEHVSGGNSFITPTGELYTGAGRDEGFYANNGLEDFKRQGIRAFIIQKLSDNWDLKLAASNWWFSRYGSIVFGAGGINWPAQTITLTSRKNDQKIDDETIVLDVNGKYSLGKIALQSTFGSTYEHNHSISRILSWVPGVFNPITVPIANPGLDNIYAPNPSNATGGLPSGTNTYKANFYFQQTASVIPDRLTLVAGITSSKIKTNNISNLHTGAMGTTVEGKENLHRYGVVFNITKEIAAYAMESTTFTPTSNRDINLNILPGQEGKAQEVGIKTALFGGRLSSTFAVFKIDLSNQSFNAGVRPDGISYFAPIGSTTQKGFDIDLAYSPIAGLQFVGAYYHGKVRAYRDDINYLQGVNGDNVPNSYSGQYSLVGRYEFQTGTLKGLSIGAGFTSLIGRALAPGVYVGGPTAVPMGTLKSTGATINNTPVIKVETSHELSFFASYKLNKNWLFRVNVDNALDEAYVLGGQGAAFIDPSLPRSFSFSSTYKF
jgi:iron complex outermembrane receptor protein